MVLTEQQTEGIDMDICNWCDETYNTHCVDCEACFDEHSVDCPDYE